MMPIQNQLFNNIFSFEEIKSQILADYRLAFLSREISLQGRKEVLTGKAKFGILGDGKEIPQIALSKTFQNGDFRAGYYRDQTFMLATGMATPQQLFAQLYGHAELSADPHSAGRQMNNHFGTRSLYPNGDWRELKDFKNSSSDNSPTASQMARALGLALASKKYKELAHIIGENKFSNEGQEVCFATIGDASTSEGIFWEVMNAAAVQQVPLAVSVWDDGYGISVPKKYQTTKSSISKALEGFQQKNGDAGIDIYTLKGWDYPSLIEGYFKGIQKVRATHTPALFHIEELTQPQGHSTSGSHERYKSAERLVWEKENDCLFKMRHWLVDSGIADNTTIENLEEEVKKEVVDIKKQSWNVYFDPIKKDIAELSAITNDIEQKLGKRKSVHIAKESIKTLIDPSIKDVVRIGEALLRDLAFEEDAASQKLKQWLSDVHKSNKEKYNTFLFNNSKDTPLKVSIVPVQYPEKPKFLSGFQVLNACFNANFERDKRILAFGEDVGKIGDVNQAFAGLQEKFGKERVYDTGIREASIIGEGIGLAMRGLRPIAEIQYLDYLMYGLQPLVDDVTTLSYRSKGGQKAPLIVRTRGHRLEGIWHAGSPMGMLVNALRGMHICVPRNMTQAAGFYNLLLRGDEPALVIECLNGYRLKEKIPGNPGDFTIPLGVPEVLNSGNEMTLVTYGSCVRIAQEAISFLAPYDISVELIDVQTLLPFDIHNIIGESLKKTNRLVLFDEDVPGGCTAYMMQQILDKNNNFDFLDAKPITISATEHRTAYGSDGDYYCKPNADEVFKILYTIMHNAQPEYYPLFF
jgi:pyruvate/2-oxoglutarate/acetoin dehydrogenase E1 component/TPP-dependent pyruvate/acetoin dehydrogenase alpha subunit